jgi:hypothetical protein
MKKLLLGASMLLAMIGVSLGTYWLTVRYHKADIKQVAEQKNEHPLPVLVYATSTTDTASGARALPIRGDGPKIKCAVVDDSVNMTPPLKGCEIVVSDADFQGKVALQNIEDFEIWGTAQVDANGTYSKAVRRDRYVYITANYSDWQRPIEDVFVSEITNAGLTSPKKIFSCDERGGCYSLNSDLSASEPGYLTRETVDGYILIYQHTLEKDAVQKKLIATVELNGWTSGVECLSDYCNNGQDWALNTNGDSLSILRFERFVTPNEPWGYGQKESTYLLLDHRKAIQN